MTLSRFAREARLSVKIKSEHVVRVIDVGTVETGTPYMVMELLTGLNLADYADAHGELPVEDVVEYVLQALEAIAEAHALGIVHRDLKPANLFVTTRRDGSSCIKVLDFGISKTTRIDAASAALTQTATIMGSPAFMSPEQWLSEDVDARADIWAIGAILFKLLAGRVPFEGDTIARLCGSVLNSAPPSLCGIRKDVPKPLEDVILRCLEKRRDQRYRDVAELAFALAPFGPARARLSVKNIAITLDSQEELAGPPSSTHEVAAGVALQAASQSSARGEQPSPTTQTSMTVRASRGGRAPVIGLAALALIALGGVGALTFRDGLAGSADPAAGVLVTPASTVPTIPSVIVSTAPAALGRELAQVSDAAPSIAVSDLPASAPPAVPSAARAREGSAVLSAPPRPSAKPDPLPVDAALAASSSSPTPTAKHDLGGRH